jgi:hypothetical protein
MGDELALDHPRNSGASRNASPIPPWKPATPTPPATASSSPASGAGSIARIVQIGTISRNRRSRPPSDSASMVEDELGGDLGYGPWSLVWSWMQNDDDPLKRLTVTNCRAERDLMRTLRRWRRVAEERGYSRIAELADYLQADERMHVRLATDWIRRLADAGRQEELVRWGREAVARIERFYADRDCAGADDVRFTFMEDGARDDHRGPLVIGE